MKKSKPKVKEKKKDEENFDFMKTNKDNIKNVLKDNNINPIINELVSRTNKIVVHSYQFLKLYFIHFIHLFHNNQPSMKIVIIFRQNLSILEVFLYL